MKAENQASYETLRPADLSDLENFTFGTAWDRQAGSGRSFAPSRSGFSDSTTKPQRRPAAHARSGAHRQEAASEQRPHRKPFVPAFAVSFLPDPKALDTLFAAIRKSRRVYRLFNIAQLVLQKPERLRVCLAPLSGVVLTEAGAEAPHYFYQSCLDGLPFESEEAVLDHVFKQHGAHFFKIETVSVEPPKGVFKTLARCSLSGKLLGPTNYHRYNEIIKQHHAQHFPKMPFFAFLEKIEKVHDEALISEWLESMRSEVHYELIEAGAAQPKVFRYTDEAMRYLADHEKNRIFEKKAQVRFSGAQIDAMPQGPMRDAIEAALSQQRKFPLETSKTIVPFLRQAHFYLFKEGDRKITYVSAIKRRRLDSDVQMSASVGPLLTVILNSKLTTRETLLADADGDTVAHEGRLSSLDWLISEGYVFEYEDGHLQALAPSAPRPNKTSAPAVDQEPTEEPPSSEDLL